MKLRLVNMHYKNPRNPKRTICGHDATIPGRTYSNVTSKLDSVTCSACRNAIKNSKRFKEMINKES